MRVKSAIGVDARVQQHADIVAVGQDPIHELPRHFAHLFVALGVPEEVLAVLHDGDVGVHAAAVDAHHGLGKEANAVAHLRGHLAADELVELDLIGGGDHVAVAVVDLELRRRHFRMVLLVLEAHGALHFGDFVDKGAQRIAGQRVIVTTGVDVFKLAGLVILALGVFALEKEAFDFVGGVQRVAFLLEKVVGILLEHGAEVGAVRGAVLVDHFAEDHHFAGAEDIGGRPVEGIPVDVEAQVALALSGKAADRRAVEGEVVPAFDQKLLVVVQHVQAAFKIAKQQRDGLDARRVVQVFEPLRLDDRGVNARLALGLGGQVQVFQLCIRECQKV